MDLFFDNYFLRKYDNIYNFLNTSKQKDYENFKKLFLSSGQNNIDKEFNNLVNPNKISILKNESNLSKIDYLFSEILSLFPNKNIIDNQNNINNNDNNINNFIMDDEIKKNKNIIINSEIKGIKIQKKINKKPKIRKFLKSKRKRATGRIKKNSSLIGVHNKN